MKLDIRAITRRAPALGDKVADGRPVYSFFALFLKTPYSVKHVLRQYWLTIAFFHAQRAQTITQSVFR